MHALGTSVRDEGADDAQDWTDGWLLARRAAVAVERDAAGSRIVVDVAGQYAIVRDARQRHRRRHRPMRSRRSTSAVCRTARRSRPGDLFIGNEQQLLRPSGMMKSDDAQVLRRREVAGQVCERRALSQWLVRNG